MLSICHSSVPFGFLRHPLPRLTLIHLRRARRPHHPRTISSTTTSSITPTTLAPLLADPSKVCSVELQQLAEALAVPGGAKPFTHPGMDALAQAGAHALFAESQLQALEAGAAAGRTVAAAAAGIPVVLMAHSVVSPMCQALGLPVRGQTTGSGGPLTGGGSGGVPAGAAAAPPHPPGGISTTPRVDALEGKSIPGEFQVFLSEVIPWVAPSSRVAALAMFPDLARAELERSWLKAQGPCADPALLRGAAVSAALCSASDLLKTCVVFGEGGHAVANLTNPSGGVGLGNGVSPFLITAPDTSGSEAEKRERTALREDAVLLISSLGHAFSASAMIISHASTAGGPPSPCPSTYKRLQPQEPTNTLVPSVVFHLPGESWTSSPSRPFR